MYYIAYGSNLNVEQMAYRCPSAIEVGTAVLKGYQLNFRGSKSGNYLTIDRSNEDFVPVAVWKITEKDLEALDRYEGYPTFYDRVTIKVKYRGLTSQRNRTVDAFVYIMTGDRSIGLPSLQYVYTCMSGYRNFGFSTIPLVDAYNRSLEAFRSANRGKK